MNQSCGIFVRLLKMPPISDQAHLYCKALFCQCACLCFTSSETSGRTSMKLGKIDHHSEVSIVRCWRRDDNVTIEDDF